MAGEVHLPVVGGVSKKALIIGGSAAAALVGFIYLRKRSQSGAAAPAAAGGTAATDTTGQGDYVDPGLTDTSGGPTYGSTGYVDPNTGQWVYGNTGTGQAAATTDAAWAQLAEQYLIQNNGADPAALSSAIGKYLTGRAVTAAEESLIDQAIAVEGYPPQGGPNGYPPGIRQAGTASQGGTGGSGGGVTGSAKAITAVPGGLHATNVTSASARVVWTAPHVPTGQGPLTGYGVEVFDSHGHHTGNGAMKVGPGQHYANLGGLKSRTRYRVNVWADPAKSGGPHASTSFTTK